MSRIGKQPIAIAQGVKVSAAKHGGGTTVKVEGPKGKLDFDFRDDVSIDVETDSVVVARRDDAAFSRSYHGTVRALIANMVEGVSKGFEKKLTIIGVGYNAKLQGKKLVLQIGFCHPVEMVIPTGLELECASPQAIAVRGADKQLVGEFAAKIRKIRPPEPYKGKGIRYHDEQVIRKAGKAFGSGE